MSYKISNRDINKNIESGRWLNITANCLLASSDRVIAWFEYAYQPLLKDIKINNHLMKKKPQDYSGEDITANEAVYKRIFKYKEEKNIDDKARCIKEFIGAGFEHEMLANIIPSEDTSIFILEYEPTTTQILKIFDNAPKIIILYDTENNLYLISTQADFANDSLAYTYMTIDDNIPIDFIPSKQEQLSDEGYKEIQMFLKKIMSHRYTELAKKYKG